MYRKSWAAIATAGLVSGCASTPQTLPTAGAANLSGQRVAVTRHPVPALEAGKLGSGLVEQYNLEDPAARIGRGVAVGLVADRNMTLLPMSGSPDSSDAVDALVANYQDADYLVDLKTLEWSIKGYRLNYVAQMRLISVTDGRVAVESKCRSSQGDADNPPAPEQLVQDDARLLRGYLDMAVTRCIDVLSREVLQLRDDAGPAFAELGAPMPINEREPMMLEPPASLPEVSAPVVAQAPVEPAPFEASFSDRPAPAFDAWSSAQDARPPMPPKPAAPVQSAPTMPVPVLAETLPQAAPQPIYRAESAPEQAVVTPDHDIPQRDALSPAARAAGQAYFLLDDTPVRDSPRLSTRSTVLRAGTEVIVRQRVYNAEGEWWFVSIPGDIGWIPSPDRPPTRR